MQKNELKEIKKKKKKVNKIKEPRGDSRVGKALRSILDGSILTKENALRLLPFVLLLTLICIIYIANSYYAERTVIRTDKIRNELKDLKNEFISSKSALMMCSKQSEVVAMLDSTGIIESLEPPKKIFVQSNAKQ